ncbi:hypothetical protein [Neolewinella sp.]|uniref:hypothetical protein n=1 Tax=Neolewinella sp. TaxID=2993543 RepID=UPI003B52D3AF
MFDLLLTIALIYFAYRGYQWYTHMKQQVKGGPPPPHNIDHSEPEERDDYIDYEEVK